MMEVFKPLGHQEKGISWLMSRPVYNSGGAGLFFDPGLGKTACVLSAFKKLKEQGLVKSMVIIAPLKVTQVTWPVEIRKWLQFSGLSFTILHGKDKDTNIKKEVDIYLINYDGIDWLTSKTSFKRVPDILVFDELSKMKSWSSKRVKAMKPFLSLFKYRWGLTGTPVPNGFQDLFSQVYMLDNGKTFGKYITKFREEYLTENQYTFGYTIKPGAEEIISNKIKPLCLRMEGSDWLSLPQEIKNNISLTLPPKLFQQYIELQKELITQLETTTITASSAAILSNKLRQFLSGSIYTENRVIIPIHTLKVEALKELVDEQQGNPLLVGYYYQHEALAYKDAFKTAIFLSDYKEPKALQAVVKKWNNGDIPLLFGHPNSIGHGLNLQGRCHTVAFTTLDFNMDNHLQFIKRVARQGQQSESVVIHYILFEKTIDILVKKVVDGKIDLQTGFLNAIKELQ